MLNAKNHLDPLQNNNARAFAKKVVIFLSDGIPNLKSSGSAAIDTYIGNNPSVEWFSAGSNTVERNAALMQTSQIQTKGWKTFAVGIGLGCDRTLMDRMARSAGTAVVDPNNPTGSKISPFANGNPAGYPACAIKCVTVV